MQPEYKYYNKVVVTLFCAGESYVISNINRTGILSKVTSNTGGPHLQSFSIALTGMGANNLSAAGSTGRLTLVDCNDAVLSFLMAGFDKYKDTAPGDGSFPKILVELDCFTGHYNWGGCVTRWDLAFPKDGIPLINFEWTIFPIDIGEVKDEDSKNAALVDALYRPAAFYDVGALINAVQTRYFPDFKVDYVYVQHKGLSLNIYKNSEIKDVLKFKRGFITIDPSNINNASAGSQLISFYHYITENMCTVDNEPVVFMPAFTTANVNDKPTSDKTSFVVGSTSFATKGEYEDDNTKAMKELHFTFGGNKQAYSSTEDGKFIIPVDEYSCTLDNRNVNLCELMIGTINGGICGTSTGACKVVNADAAENNTEANAKLRNAFEFQFKCSNVACFQCNNLAAPVCIDVYDEQGNKRPYLSVNNAVAVDVSYDFSEPVVEASVKCTTAFGELVKNNTNNATPATTDDDSNSDKQAE